MSLILRIIGINQNNGYYAFMLNYCFYILRPDQMISEFVLKHFILSRLI